MAADMTPLDRAARALILAKHARCCDPRTADLIATMRAASDDVLWRAAKDEVRAVLAALDPPTPAMQVAGHTAALAWADAHDVESRIFSAMAAAAGEGE